MILCPDSLKDLNVNVLMFNTGRWNEPMIRSLFLATEADSIIQMPLPRWEANDEVIWGLDKKSLFTVKSAYHLGVNGQVRGEASSSSYDYGMPIPPKAKIACWRALNDILPSNSNLFMKGIHANMWCVFCRKQEETAKHLSWECSVTKDMWSFFLNFNINLLSWNRSMMSSWDFWDGIRVHGGEKGYCNGDNLGIS